MTPEEIALKFQLRKDTASVVYHGRKVEYFVEENPDKYNLYFLVTDPTFDEKCDKEKLHDNFASMKKYLYDEGFLDSCVKDTDPDKNWKIHFLVQYHNPQSTKLDLSENHKKPQTMFWVVFKTSVVIIVVWALLKWLFLL